MKTLARRVTAEFAGILFLVAAVVGSGSWGDHLSGGNVAIALLANTIATGAAPVALILTFGPISGTHFNPAVTVADAMEHGIPWREVTAYLAAQCLGGIAGAIVAPSYVRAALVFALITCRERKRASLQRVHCNLRPSIGDLGMLSRSLVGSAFRGGLLFTAAYRFTASTSFANPAVTIARVFSDTFAGISPADVPFFVIAQIAGAFSATMLFRWLVPSLPAHAADVLVKRMES